MFYVAYIAAELRRRKGRTFLTALGLGVGVALVVAVTALSKGLDKAQDKVLQPLTGVGTDMSVTRPLKLSGQGFQDLTPKERDQLRKENGGGRFKLTDLGQPGHKFSTDIFNTATQLSFPASTVDKIAKLDGVQAVAGGLTVNATHVSGRVPTQSEQPQAFGKAPAGGGGGMRPRSLGLNSRSVTGIDASQPSLAPVSKSDVTRGDYLTDDHSHQALVNASYAKRNGIAVGDTVKLKDTKFKVVGIVKTPLGGQASDIYVKLGQLQKLAAREGRANVMYVRADSIHDVGKVASEIKQVMSDASVTTAKDLADRVGGSLTDAKNLTSKLGTALTIVGLVAAVLIASLLTLSSVTKRVRELGTLKALGWPQRLVVRQVTGESLAQGVLGGAVGIALGLAAAAVITAIGPTLTASVAQNAGGGAGPGPGLLGGFGQQIAAGSTHVTLDAPVDATLMLVAVGLAVLGGLLSGAVGGLRAARLRPAHALRHID